IRVREAGGQAPPDDVPSLDAEAEQSGGEGLQPEFGHNFPDEGEGEVSNKERRQNRRMINALWQASREIEERERRRAERKGREYVAPRDFGENTRYLREQLEFEDQDAPGGTEEDEGRAVPKRRNRKSKSKSKSKKKSRTEAMKPTAQIMGESALGHAFRRVRDLNGSDPSKNGSS
ncbi:hypothetical protein C0993_001858, partial [Termitomyces sp. T159_Od127]